MYQRHGPEHTAVARTLVTFRARSAVRDVAKALGFPHALAEWRNLLFAGTMIVRGCGTAIVVATGQGQQIELEHIAGMTR